MAIVSKRIILQSAQFDISRPPQEGEEEGVAGLMKILDVEDNDVYIIPLSGEAVTGLIDALQQLSRLKVVGVDDMPQPPNGA